LSFASHWEKLMQFETDTGLLYVEIDTLIIAGWTARDENAVQHHIDELAAIGILAPSATPLYYRVGHELITQAEVVEVLGSESSGEAEPLIVRSDGKLWLGLGSDHTDRKLEAVSVAASKQVCPKPVAPALWEWQSVEPHLDAIELKSEIFEDGAWVSYQSGNLGAIRPLAELIQSANLRDDAAMMCGTLGAIGGVRPARQFRAVLHDPVLGRTITLSYIAAPLPVIA
jgi:hypothetical protein